MAEDTKQFDIQPLMIQGYNSEVNRKLSIATNRKSTETDFINGISMDYQKSLYSPHVSIKNQDPKLSTQIIKKFKEEADSDEGIIWKETMLNSNAQNLGQETIKAYKQDIANYYEKLESMGKLGGYLTVGIEPLMPENLPDLLSDIGKYSFNGNNEGEQTKTMFQAFGWANGFDHTDDVKVSKDFRYEKDINQKDVPIFNQSVNVAIDSEMFKKYLHYKPFVMEDFKMGKNISQDPMTGRWFYNIQGEVDGNQAQSGEILDLFMTEAQPAMKVGDAMNTAGIVKDGSIQPQYFLGGTIPTTADAPDTALKLNVQDEKNGKIYNNELKFINTDMVNKNLTYNSEVSSEVEGLFANGSGNPAVLYNYAVNNLGIDLPVGFFEEVNTFEADYYHSLNPIQKASFPGNRYKFNMAGGKPISLLNSQKAWFNQYIQEKNLDTKLRQNTAEGEPSLVKTTLDDSEKSRSIIDFLNTNNLPLPEFYANHLGINKWQAGLPVFYQEIPKGITNNILKDDLDKLLAKYTS